MTITISNTTTAAVGGLSGTTFTQSVVRAAGEGLLAAFMVNNSFGSPSTPTGAVWDPTGDNQAMTLLLTGAVDSHKALAVFYLANPTSVKTGDIVLTNDGSNNGSTFVSIRH